MLKQNLEKVFNEIKDGNNLNEPITLVGAGKFVDVATLQQAVDLGLKIIGDNKVQEFRDKTSLVKNVSYHFIGRLQKNKVKYLVGKVDLIHSVDSVALGEEISRQSVKNNVVTNVLLEVNLGEESKTGFDLDKTYDAVKTISALPNVKVLGLMSMLPNIDDNDVLSKLCLQIRSLYDIIKNDGYDFKYLSLGMSGDYKIAIQNGSNMIRLGSCLFGARNYQV
jgi:pyridoxal phosphate enzyme (YggS family)